MSNDVYVGRLPFGRRLDPLDDRGSVATFGVLVDATPEVLDLALRYWPQVDPDDYQVNGKH